MFHPFTCHAFFNNLVSFPDYFSGINVRWKLLAAVAVMQFHWRCVVLAMLWKLLSHARVLYKNKIKTSGFSQSQVANGGVFSACGFCHTALQSFKCVCVCVERWHVCIHKAQFPSSPHSAQQFCFQWTLVWLFCHETYLLSSPDPMVSRYNSANNARTPPCYGHASSPQIPSVTGWDVLNCPPRHVVLGPSVPLRMSCPPMSERLQKSYIILCAILSNKFVVNFHKTTLDYAWLAWHTGYTAVQVCWLDSN